MALIAIEGMEFFAYHGCFDEEQIIGTRFIVYFDFDVDTSKAEISDELSETVNYQQVYAVVKREMSKNSKLLEHVARRILEAVCNEFSQIKYARVKVSKINPPLGGKIQSVSVTLSSEDIS